MRTPITRIAALASLTLAALLLRPASASAQEGEWMIVDSLPDMRYIALDCVDPLRCAAVVDSVGWIRYVRITEDGWRTSRFILLDSLNLYDPDDPYIQHQQLYYPATNRLYVGAASAALLMRSTDGGASWDSTFFGEMGGGITYMEWVNALTGFACSGSNVFRTTDAGATWNRMPLPDTLSLAVYSASALSANEISFIIGRYQFRWLLATRDGGRTWRTQPAPNDVDKIEFVDSLYGWTAGGAWHGRGVPMGHRIHRTTDGGATWQEQLEDHTYILEGIGEIHALDRRHARAVGGRDEIYLTDDGGDTWVRERSPLDATTFPRLIDLRYTSLGSAYAIASNYRLLMFCGTSDVAEPTDASTTSLLTRNVLRAGERFGVRVAEEADAVELWDVLGRRVSRTEGNDGELELTAPETPGWYYVRVVGSRAGDPPVVAVRVE